MKKNTTGRMYTSMSLSEMIGILESVKEKYGDLPVRGECNDCTSSDMNVWILTAANEMDEVIIQVSTDETED